MFYFLNVAVEKSLSYTAVIFPLGSHIFKDAFHSWEAQWFIWFIYCGDCLEK